MLVFLEPSQLGPNAREHLLASLAAASTWQRPALDELWAELEAGLLQAFEWKGAFLALRRETRDASSRLVIAALHDPSGEFGIRMRGLTAALQRLAREWECDKIETTCYSSHLAEIIHKLGGTVECVTMILEA